MAKKEMSNLEILKNHDVLKKLQELETKLFEDTGKRLLQGRVKVGYAINKNIAEFENATQPYKQTLKDLENEYRDLKAEKAALEEASRNGISTIEMIFKDVNKKEEFFKKKTELLEVVSEVNVFEVELELLDGIELNSTEIGTLMFMIKE